MKATTALVGIMLSLSLGGVAYAAESTPVQPPIFDFDLISAPATDGGAATEPFQIDAVVQLVPIEQTETVDGLDVISIPVQSPSVYAYRQSRDLGTANVVEPEAVVETETVEAEPALATETASTAVYGIVFPSTDAIDVNGTLLSFIDVRSTNTVPSTGAGVWKGSASTTDGSYAYFVGHNPGSFTCVANLVEGDDVTVWDDNGAWRTYTVTQIFDIPDTTYWEDLEPNVTGYGESIVMQTCMGPHTYRIVIAE